MAAFPQPAALGMEDKLENHVPETTESKPRRGSWFDRFHKNKHHEHVKESPLSETSSMQDNASVYTTNTTNSGLPLLGKDETKVRPKKEKRESISDRGPFRIEYTPDGQPIAIENKDWPPGVSYKTSSQIKQLQGMDAFYEGKGAIVAGGENAANIGPDPDWIPGLSEAERAKLRGDKSGNYVF